MNSDQTRQSGGARENRSHHTCRGSGHRSTVFAAASREHPRELRGFRPSAGRRCVWSLACEPQIVVAVHWNWHYCRRNYLCGSFVRQMIFDMTSCDCRSAVPDQRTRHFPDASQNATPNLMPGMAPTSASWISSTVLMKWVWPRMKLVSSGFPILTVFGWMAVSRFSGRPAVWEKHGRGIQCHLPTNTYDEAMSMAAILTTFKFTSVATPLRIQVAFRSFIWGGRT
jgi:hypothetical protein